MRYFLVSYYHTDQQGSKRGYGHVCFEHEKFPSMDVLKNNVQEPNDFMVILNIIELKSEQDFKDYKGDGESESEVAFLRWKNAFYEVLNKSFNFTAEMIDVSLLNHPKSLQEYFDESNTVGETIEAIYKLKLEDL